MLEYPENPHEHFPLHDALYFVIITITTVGYGDITPQQTISRMAALLMVSTTFVLLPLQTSKLIELQLRRDELRHERDGGVAATGCESHSSPGALH